MRSIYFSISFAIHFLTTIKFGTERRICDGNWDIHRHESTSFLFSYHLQDLKCKPCLKSLIHILLIILINSLFHFRVLWMKVTEPSVVDTSNDETFAWVDVFSLLQNVLHFNKYSIKYKQFVAINLIVSAVRSLICYLI